MLGALPYLGAGLFRAAASSVRTIDNYKSPLQGMNLHAIDAMKSAMSVASIPSFTEYFVPDEVRDNPAQRRFELNADGGTAATYYDLSPGVITFTHTEVPPALEGRGIGSKLARGALDAVRAQGLKVVAECPFIRGYIERHPEFQDLLV